MDNFDKYSKYYDLLYKDKQYDLEASYIDSLLTKYKPKCKRILELGCGSGNHAFYFSKLGFEIYGIEQSEEMVQISKKKNIKNFYPHIGNIINFQFDLKFDIAISLFHVISYLDDNDTLIKCFKNINRHLNLEGLFIFDFWYTPAVYIQKPETRIKRLENEHISVLRIAESSIDYIKNTVNVNFEVLINDKIINRTEIINEIHKMRHFSIPELGFLASISGFEIILSEEYLTKNVPSEKTWGVSVIFKKIKNIL